MTTLHTCHVCGKATSEEMFYMLHGERRGIHVECMDEALQREAAKHGDAIWGTGSDGNMGMLTGASATAERRYREARWPEIEKMLKSPTVWNSMQQQTTHDWIVVIDSGNVKALVDKNSLERRGDIVRALFMYSQVPPGTDKRNGKPVEAMLLLEDYDLRSGAFRVRRITLHYSDGTNDGSIHPVPIWRPASPRNLEFLRRLDYVADDRISVGGIVLDATVAGFDRVDVKDFESTHPGLGYAVAYHGEWRGKATIYAYNMRLGDIPDGPNSEIVRREFERTTQEALSLATSSSTCPDAEIKLADRYGTLAPGPGREGYLCGEFILTDEHGPRRTFLYLTGASGNFVKIRVTLRTNDPTDPTARQFADAVACGLWW